MIKAQHGSAVQVCALLAARPDAACRPTRRTWSARLSTLAGLPTARMLHGIGHCRRAVAAVEFALVAMPLLILIFGFVSMSAVFYTFSSMQNAAQYAAMLVSTGQIKNVSTGALSSSNTTATTSCSGSLVSTEAEYYACGSLPSWASYTVTTTENCATPSVEVSLSASASAAAIVDIFQFFTGKSLVANATEMKEGSCP
jgi:Flp pilus assembly protein TadG